MVTERSRHLPSSECTYVIRQDATLFGLRVGLLDIHWRSGEKLWTPQLSINGAHILSNVFKNIFHILIFHEVKLCSDWNWCVCVCVCVCVSYELDQFRGPACVSIGFPDVGTPGVPKHVVRKWCVDCVIFRAWTVGYMGWIWGHAQRMTWKYLLKDSWIRSSIGRSDQQVLFSLISVW
jgi:hypothetical protein